LANEKRPNEPKCVKISGRSKKNDGSPEHQGGTKKNQARKKNKFNQEKIMEKGSIATSGTVVKNHQRKVRATKKNR